MADIVISGNTSGAVTLRAPDVSGTTLLTLPTTSGTIAVTGGSPSFSTLTVTGGANFATSSGNVGIGNSSPVSRLDVTGIARFSSTSFVAPSGGRGVEVWYQTDSDKGFTGAFDRGGSVYKPFQLFGSQIEFNLNGSEAMRIDSSNRLLLGTTSALSNSLATFGNTTGSVVGWGFATLQNCGTITPPTAVGLSLGWNYSNGGGENNIVFGIAAGSTPGLSFSSFNGTTVLERMRITSGGYLKASNNGAYVSITGPYHEFISNDASNGVAVIESTNASYTSYALFVGAARNTANNSYYAIGYFNRAALAYRFLVADSGNVTNTNGSYGTISDVKNKENIVDATPKLDKVNQLKVRNYNLIGSDLKQIGFVAQELEEVFPSMVEEHRDRDENGQDLGTTTKTIKTTVLIPILVKAIQEQQTMIQELKARIDVLEGAK